MRILKKIWEVLKKGWMKFAHILGVINTTILLSIMYFVVVGVYSIISRIINLVVWPFKKAPQTYWYDHKECEPDSYKHPF